MHACLLYFFTVNNYVHVCIQSVFSTVHIWGVSTVCPSLLCICIVCVFNLCASQYSMCVCVQSVCLQCAYVCAYVCAYILCASLYRAIYIFLYLHCLRLYSTYAHVLDSTVHICVCMSTLSQLRTFSACLFLQFASFLCVYA